MKLGNIARGDDFFDRKRELEDLQRYCRDNHIALVGPRRLGKSSLLTRFQEILNAEGVLTVYLDVQGMESIHSFLEALDSALPDESIRNYLGELAKKPVGWLRNLKKIDIQLPADAGGFSLETRAENTSTWEQKAQALQTRLLRIPVFILIDEFPVLLEKLIRTDARQAEAFLGWLRTWRLDQNMAGRFVYSGSIGLNALLERHRLSAYFNDPQQMKLGPFKRHAAEAMLRHFAQDECWVIQDTTVAHLCDRTGWLSPFYLNLLLDQSFLAARDRWDETGDGHGEIEPQDVDDGYERLLSSRSRFIRWQQRLHDSMAADDYRLCETMLTAITKSSQGLTPRQLNNRLMQREPDPDKRERQINLLLSRLDEEGYLSAPDEQGRIRFLSFLLRDWWERNHA